MIFILNPKPQTYVYQLAKVMNFGILYKRGPCRAYKLKLKNSIIEASF